MPENKIVCEPKLFYQPNITPDYPYNVQLWYSDDEGESFWYVGGRFFKERDNATKWMELKKGTIGVGKES